MPAQWTGELVGRMHNAGVTAKQLASEMGKNPKYVSQVLNGHYSPKKAEAEFNEAFKRLISPTHKPILPQPLSHSPDFEPEGLEIFRR